MTSSAVLGAADLLDDSRSSRRPLDTLTRTWPDLGLDDAYAIQAEMVRRRIGAGERIVGRMIARAQPPTGGVPVPITGVLLSDDLLPADRPLDVGDLLRPRVEPQLAFLLARDLAGPAVTSAAVLSATSSVCGALLVSQARFEGAESSASDLVADGASGSRLLLGGRSLPANAHDWAMTGVLVGVDGTQIATGAGAASWGHPATAIAALANALATHCAGLTAGDLVLAGGMTDPIAVSPGKAVVVDFAHLGSIALRAV